VRDPVLQQVPLGFQWPTVDPFLFCVHHLDRYPAGNERLGPVASLDGRDLGMDFAGVDGWRMYHGQTVPGFPQHPHRGFETVTFVRQGLVDHSDSLGATARYGGGDTQWLTAGGGIVHAEMFPLVHAAAPNTLELFQIWVNLPSDDKMAEPHFSMLWSEATPIVHLADGEGRVTEVTVVAGELAGHRPPPPPPDSWASRPGSDVAIWQLRLPPHGSLVLPPAASADTVRTLYLFEGDELHLGPTRLGPSTGALVVPDEELPVRAGGSGAAVLVLQGRPIGEPVVQYGPFVMNDKQGIAKAFDDYQRTGFGGWPWTADDPVHPRIDGRFARRPDGAVELAPA
jgi:redox-sensitive bicupin YhaK (pirin superfamily)